MSENTGGEGRAETAAASPANTQQGQPASAGKADQKPQIGDSRPAPKPQIGDSRPAPKPQIGDSRPAPQVPRRREPDLTVRFRRRWR